MPKEVDPLLDRFPPHHTLTGSRKDRLRELSAAAQINYEHSLFTIGWIDWHQGVLELDTDFLSADVTMYLRNRFGIHPSEATLNFDKIPDLTTILRDVGPTVIDQLDLIRRWYLSFRLAGQDLDETALHLLDTWQTRAICICPIAKADSVVGVLVVAMQQSPEERELQHWQTVAWLVSLILAVDEQQQTCTVLESYFLDGPEAAAVLDAHGRIHQANYRFLTLVSQTQPGDYLGKRPWRLLPKLEILKQELKRAKTQEFSQRLLPEPIETSGPTITGLQIRRFTSDDHYWFLLKLQEPQKGVGAPVRTDAIKRLSSREIDIAQLVARGYSTMEIAAHLDLSLKTVQYHRSNIRSKIGLGPRRGSLRAAVVELFSAAGLL